MKLNIFFLKKRNKEKKKEGREKGRRKEGRKESREDPKPKRPFLLLGFLAQLLEPLCTQNVR